MAALSRAKIYFAIGNFSPFEASRLPQIAEQVPSLTIVRLNGGLEAQKEDGHEHDPHIWTSVSFAFKILENTRNAFVTAEAIRNIRSMSESLSPSVLPVARFFVCRVLFSS
jgi:ABC-type Zn uptake system ZnuABC Zn-binding protein ZnuA